MPNEWFRDRNYYVLYAEISGNLLSDFGSNLSLLVNEPLFLTAAKLFGDTFSSDTFPKFMCAIVTSIFVYVVAKKSRTFIMFLLGMVSLFFISYLQTAQIMVLRQGVATAIFLLVFLSNMSDKKKLIICLVLSFFHSVFFIVSLLYALYLFYLRNRSTGTMLSMVAIVSAVLFLFSKFLLVYFGFRQAELYSVDSESGGGGAFVLSAIIFLYLYFYGDRSNKELYDWSLIGIVLFLVGYYLFFSAGRLYVSFFPFILVLLISRSRLQDILFLTIINFIYIILFYNGGYLILFETQDPFYISTLFSNHVSNLLDLF
ncbi:EpsG family protein [Acinetobacter baumannii]|nr:EpsG family protein [Acinetobacter baumannii]UYQ18539.1 EpsG family protein [Acinetobacter baumannii]UYQ29474.1 EpsG family protein [Acinetobacter baumannii]UYQ58857.1 EpsG family protein [Acinetobacter baumannii]